MSTSTGHCRAVWKCRKSALQPCMQHHHNDSPAHSYFSQPASQWQPQHRTQSASTPRTAKMCTSKERTAAPPMQARTGALSPP